MGVLAALSTLLGACSDSSDNSKTDAAVPESSPALTNGEANPTPSVAPPSTDTPSTTVAPVREVLSIENTMADPSEILFLGQQQRGLLPPGPDDVPSGGGGPSRPSTPCSFAWNRGQPAGGAPGEYAFIDIEACEFTTSEEAAAYADALRVDMSTPSREGAVITAVPASGEWDGVRIDIPADDDDQPTVEIERVRQYGLRVYQVSVFHQAAAPDPATWAADLVELQDTRITELALDPDTPGVGFTEQTERFTVDDVLLPWAVLTSAKPLEVSTWNSNYRPAPTGGRGFTTEEGSRQVIFADGSFISVAVTRFDTSGDAQRALIANRDRYESSARGGSIDGVADSITFGVSPSGAVVHGDRLYQITADSDLIGPLMIQLEEHLRSLGLAEGLTLDAAVPAPTDAAELAEASGQLAELFPPTLVTDVETLEPNGMRVLDLRALDWSTDPNLTRQRYGPEQRAIDLFVVVDVTQERFATRHQPAGGEVVDGWTIRIVTTMSDRQVGPNNEVLPPAEQVRYSWSKWFGTFGVVATDSVAYPSMADIEAIAGGRRDEMLSGLDEWFGDVDVPSFLTGTRSVGDRLGMTRLCDAVGIDGIDTSLSSLGSTTVNLYKIDRRTPIGGVLRAAGPSDPAGAERLCANEIEPTAEAPTGMRVEGIEFDTPEAAQAWFVATVGQTAPETLVGGLTATFVDDGTTTTAALTSGRYGFVISTTLAGIADGVTVEDVTGEFEGADKVTVDGVAIDRNVFGRSLAAGLADRVALSGLV
jgi:hypothetical protein